MITQISISGEPSWKVKLTFFVFQFPQHLHHQQPQVPMSYAFPPPVAPALPVHSSFHLGSLVFTSAPAAGQSRAEFPSFWVAVEISLSKLKSFRRSSVLTSPVILYFQLWHRTTLIHWQPRMSLSFPRPNNRRTWTDKLPGLRQYRFSTR